MQEERSLDSALREPEYNPDLLKAVCFQQTAFMKEMPAVLRDYALLRVPKTEDHEHDEYLRNVSGSIKEFLNGSRKYMAWCIAQKFAADNQTDPQLIIDSLDKGGQAPGEWKKFLDDGKIPRNYAVDAIKRLLIQYNPVVLAAGSKNNRVKDPEVTGQMLQAEKQIVVRLLPDIKDEEAQKLFHMNMTADLIRRIASGEIIEALSS